LDAERAKFTDDGWKSSAITREYACEIRKGKSARVCVEKSPENLSSPPKREDFKEVIDGKKRASFRGTIRFRKQDIARKSKSDWSTAWRGLTEVGGEVLQGRSHAVKDAARLN